MSEKRRPSFIVNFQRGQAGRGKLEIFRKSLWTDEINDRYHYRLRLNNKWMNGLHGQKQYVLRADIVATVLKELAQEDIL